MSSSIHVGANAIPPSQHEFTGSDKQSNLKSGSAFQIEFEVQLLVLWGGGGGRDLRNSFLTQNMQMSI